MLNYDDALETPAKTRVVDRWRLGRLSLQQVHNLPAVLDMVDVGRALGYTRENALAEVRANAVERGQVSSLGGVPLVKRGRSWIATQVALLHALGSSERELPA